MATETLVDKKSEEEEVKDKENEEGSKEEVTAKLLEFLESPRTTIDVLLADKEQVKSVRLHQAKILVLQRHRIHQPRESF
ncbi:hypothetical protein E1A91_A13G138000v1 [Gossypium mustelinum]|uniref:Uncharacterized protein n=1 Tax=Gossypium mustelinum TaxID=34275 RepID=A0A5D2WH90_GOSMU|nr:hypothetical protein E1A91_A13G138000v1 [Gossypium mustelinum]